MIEFKKGDILRAETEGLVNTVNCVGVMGRGIALQFKKAYPENFKTYKAVCDRKELIPGKILVHDTNQLVPPRYILNFPTKRHWKCFSSIDDIKLGLKALVSKVKELGIMSIAIPPLGCGLGGLDWDIVRPMIVDAFQALPQVQVLIYEPIGAPSAESMVKNKDKPKMTKGRAALISLIAGYLRAAMDPFVTLLEIHKLMYFLQEAGEPIKLLFEKGIYGPYATNLRHVLNAIEGHFIVGFSDGTDDPYKSILLKTDFISEANNYLTAHKVTMERLERVFKLISGFETPYGMELLSTVYWVATNNGIKTPEEAITETYNWNSRKRMLEERHIRIAWDAMTEGKWI